MKNINTYLTGKYHLSKYQVAQVVFLLKTILSELSKLLIMAILFHRQIIYYLFGLFIMIFLRCTMGGLHFYKYSQCLLVSIIYLWLSVIILPNILIYKYVKIILMIFSILICYYIGPIPSKYRHQYSKQYLTKMRLFTSKFIFFNIIYNSNIYFFDSRILDYYITFAPISYCENTFERRIQIC